MTTRKTATIDLKGKEYAQVKDRIKEFRTENPRGLIETIPDIHPDGQIMFKARILKDKSDENSAEASGHALGQNKGDKSFEKLETIAVGRALALLGYASDGDIASSDEMEEFEEYQEEKKLEFFMEMREKLEDCKTLEELKDMFIALPPEAKIELLTLKDELKDKLSKPKKTRKPTEEPVLTPEV